MPGSWAHLQNNIGVLQGFHDRVLAGLPGIKSSSDVERIVWSPEMKTGAERSVMSCVACA